jgi:beta-glucosidase/6-phospho-beta-glucosidase/beta-galactosidase
LIRVVALRKAAIAGVAGALAWEAALRAAILAGVPTFDIVKTLGSFAFPHGPAWAWWTAGMAAHALVGIGWAVFYAYFFWARFDWRPALQGLVFSLFPAALALFVMTPQMKLMRMDQAEVQLTAALIRPPLAGIEVAGLIVGHLIFGLVVGLLYTRPVGHAVDRPPPVRRRRRQSDGPLRATPGPPTQFIFATGIECSYPTIENGRWRFDQMASTGHYQRWQRDFELCREIGVSHLRYGPPLHLIFQGPGQFDWSLIDEPMADLEAGGPVPIVDMCHFGLPAWLGDFQNADIVRYLGEYAGAFAARFPWVRFYTPINEMYVCARMSALDGLWNEQKRDERSFLDAAFNIAGASVAMSDAVEAVRPDAIFINCESSEFTQACCPDVGIQAKAEFENLRRFLPLDLIYAHEVDPVMLDHLRAHDREEDYRRITKRKVPRRSVIGLDYYEWNERLVDSDGEVRALGELFGWYVIAHQYWQRYRRPMMHAETNRLDAADAPRWLWRQWHNVQLLRLAGVPLIGFTWYSLTDQVDWEIGLTRALGTVDPVGLFDLNRDPRAVALSYKHLIGMHRQVPEYRECPAMAELVG